MKVLTNNKSTNLFTSGLLIAACLFSSCDKIDSFHAGSRQIRCVVGVSGTKALPITTAGAATNGTETPLDIRDLGFTMEAYADAAYHDNETNEDFEAGIYFTKSVACTKGTPDVWTIEDEPDWINGVNIRFFCWSPIATSGTRTITPSTTVGSDELQFSYVYTPISAAYTSEAAEDLIFAYASNKAEYGDTYGESDYGELKDGSTDEIDLTFNHALAQVRFCLSTDDGTYDKSLKLVSITLKNEPNGGNCVFDGGGSIADGTMFDWTPSTTKVNFTQTFDAEFPGTGTPETIPDDWVKSKYTEDSIDYNLYTCTGDVLFLVPQEFTGKKIDITFQKGTAEPFTLEASIPDGTWEAGKYYTYKIKAVKIVSLTLFKQGWIDGSSDITL